LLSVVCKPTYSYFGGNKRYVYILLARKLKGRRHIGDLGIDKMIIGTLNHGLDCQGIRVRFLAGERFFSLLHRIQIGSRVHPASYPMGTDGDFPGGKSAGA
jgi:hypothetical protein